MTNSTIYLYADDAIIYTLAPSATQAVQNLHIDFCVIQQTLFDLKLLLNSNKTKCIMQVNFTTLNGTPIECVSSYKHLRFWIDDKMYLKNILMKSLKAKLAFF